MKFQNFCYLAVSLLCLAIACGTIIAKEEIAGPNPDGSCEPANNPVCAHGMTFQNPCLAIAQGQLEYQSGSCLGDNMHFMGDGAATAEELGQFRMEGYKLIGKVENLNERPPSYKVEMGPEARMLEGNNNNEKPTGNDKSSREELREVIRFTHDGHMYMAMNYTPVAVTVQSNTGLDVTIAPPGPDGNCLCLDENFNLEDLDYFKEDDDDFQQAEQPDDIRRLVIGNDTRINVKDVHPFGVFFYPFFLIGELDYGGDQGGCTGSIIGVNKVLTAAHCVYDAYNQRMRLPSYFAPARYRLDNGTILAPWGRWPVLSVNIDGEFRTSNPSHPGLLSEQGIGSDMAVLTVGTNKFGNIGKFIGQLEIIASPCRVQRRSTTAGYPWEKPDGEMWTSGKCDGNGWSSGCPSDRIISSFCDISPGQSGSPLYDRQKGDPFRFVHRIFGIASGQSRTHSIFFGFNDAWRRLALSW